jgi:hypothetical protein
MKLDMSYAEMSFLRDLVHAYKYERWLKEVRRIDKKELAKLDSEDLEDLRQEFWKNYDKETPIVDECCAVILTKKFHAMELNCQVALGMQQPARLAEKVVQY